MGEYGITGFGAYVPRLRLQRSAIADAHRWMAPGLKGAAKGVRAFCGFDEDAITMAVEAARGLAMPGLESVALASTTVPYADLSNAGIVAQAIGASDRVATTDVGGSQRAATSLLRDWLDSAHGEKLLVASERPVAKPASVQEISGGAGAAAVALGSDGVIARYLGGASMAAGFVDHFRSAGATHDYHWEERWVRDEGYAKLVPAAIARALAEASVEIGDIAHLSIATPMRGVAAMLAKMVGFAGAMPSPLDESCGYTGAAQPLLLLAEVLERAVPGDRILLVGFGQGVDALVLEATELLAAYRSPRPLGAALRDALVTTDYMRMLSFYGGVSLEWGMRGERVSKASLTEAYRASDQLTAFNAGRCPACDTLQFPVLAYCVNPGCGASAREFTQQSLAGEEAQVFTYTADRLSYHPAPPLYVGFAQFDCGPRVLMEVVDVDPAAFDVGTRLRMVFRIKERDEVRGFNRYFWKATPITTATQGD